MNSAVPGLARALKHYDSDKVRDRTTGAQELREIFSNRGNIEKFQQEAFPDNGAGWVYFFQILFQVVVLEKKAATKRSGVASAIATAERRLASAVSLVRWMAERTVHLLSRKAFLAVFTHMMTLLVHDGAIFEPVAVDYAKALRTLLSYQPHLEHLDRISWRKLMGICWAGVLGDRVSIDDDEWLGEAVKDDQRDSGETNDGNGKEEDSDDDGGGCSRRHNSTLSGSVANEIIALIPVLLSSSNAPLVPVPSDKEEDTAEPVAGFPILCKIRRYLTQNLPSDSTPVSTNGHSSTQRKSKQLPQQPGAIPLDILRALNLVLAELELNSRDQFTFAACRIFPQLVTIWTTKHKSDLSVREHLLIAMRMMLPFIAHPYADEDATDAIIKMRQKDNEASQASMTRFTDSLSKESTLRGAIRPLDLESLRFITAASKRQGRSDATPFELTVVTPGFGFDASQALSWAAVQLYADCIFQTYDAPGGTSAATQAQRRKRQRTESTLDKLISVVSADLPQTRTLACQVLVFLVDKHWAELQPEARDLILQTLLDLLDDDDVVLQSWSFVGLSCLAFLDDGAADDPNGRAMPMTPSGAAARRRQEQTAWECVWAYAIRKTTFAPVSRVACYAANSILVANKVDHAKCVRDVHALLKNIDIQGPAVVSEGSCTFLISSLAVVRADASLYRAHLEDKVVDWFSKTFAVENVNRGRSRLSAATPADQLSLLSAICSFSGEIANMSVKENLPDCPIVNRILQEEATSTIRSVILYCEFPKPTSVTNTASSSPPPTTTEAELGFLDGRPRKLSDSLKTEVLRTTLEWTQNDRRNLITADRLRKTIDLIVLVFAFQAAVQANGLRPDTVECLLAAANLLGLLIPHLRNLSDNIPAQQLVWLGFVPLYSSNMPQSDTWPVLLKPDIASGVRRDILPSQAYALHAVQESDGRNNPLLSIIWRKPELTDVLSDLLEVCKSTLESVRTPVRGSKGGGTAMIVDDDDFGPIISAETDAMPQSLEAKEAQHSTESLLKTLVDLRLRGPLLATADHRPTKDVNLVNTFVSAEGALLHQLGFVICDAIREGSLRLTFDVVEFILEELTDRLRTYSYQRSPEMTRLAIMFLSRSVFIWLAEESDLSELGMQLARKMVQLAQHQRLASWQTRLQLILFIDEYLDYDPSFDLWLKVSDSEQVDVLMGGDQAVLGPIQFILDSTGDVDSRVRFRAASSFAGINYLPDLPTEVKSQAYFDTMAQMASKAFMWDHYLTELVWKLNICLASAQLRDAAMYHLYELADFRPAFIPHLETGIEAVAVRLGLDSLKALYAAHANSIVCTQLDNGQLPMRISSKLYGCATRKEFALLCLDVVGPRLLSDQKSDFFSSLCEAASVTEAKALEKYLPSAAAIVVPHAVTALSTPITESELAVQCNAALNSLPPPGSEVDIDALVTDNVEAIVSTMFSLIDLSATNEEVVAALYNIKPRYGDVFEQLMAQDMGPRDPPPVLYPSVALGELIYGHSFFHANFAKMSRRRMLFDALIRMFNAINTAWLVNEQRRYLRAIGMLASLYQDEFQLSTVIERFLRNVIDLLTKDDIAGVAQSMLEWGFEQLLKVKQVPEELADLMINLGTVYTKLDQNKVLKPTQERLDAWIADRAPVWMKCDTIAPALQTAVMFWPPHWRAHFSSLPDPTFLDIAGITEGSRIRDPMALCRHLVTAAENSGQRNKELFLSSTFWYLKKALSSNHDEAMSFLNLLYMTDADVHAPSIEAIKGFTGRSNMYEVARKYASEPDMVIRVLILCKVFELTMSDDYRLRTTAFQVLQKSQPTLVAQQKKANITQSFKDLITFLVPLPTVVAATDVKVETLVDESAGWVYKSRSHKTWATELALLLSKIVAQDDPFYVGLRELLTAQSHAAIDLLPLIVHAFLTCGSDNHPEVTVQRAAALSDHFAQVLQYPLAATETLETIIQIHQHLRHFNPSYVDGPLAINHWLAIDPLVLSEAAGRCGAYVSSLLYLEMAQDRDDTDGRPDLDLSSSRIQKIMYDIYSNVEDPDGFYGIQNNDVMDSLLRRLDHEGQPLRSLGYNLAEFEASPAPGGSRPLIASLRNLHNLGFNNLAGTVMNSSRREQQVDGGAADADPLLLELAWRMGDWEVPLSRDQEATSTGRLYASLRAVHRERDRTVACQVVDTAIKSELLNLQRIGVERMTEIKHATTNLVCLRDIALWLSPPMQKAIDQGDFEGSLINNFVKLDSSFKFDNVEQLSATRLSVIQSARARESKNLMGDLMSVQSEGLANLEIACQLRLSQLSRKDDNLQAAVNAMVAVRQLEGMVPQLPHSQDEFGEILWAQGEHSLAIQYVEGIMKTLDPKRHGRRLGVMRGRWAHWTAEAKLKSFDEIRGAFDSAAKLAVDNNASVEEQGKLAYNCAMFWDQELAILIRSPELERLKSVSAKSTHSTPRRDSTSRSSPSSSPSRRQQEIEEDDIAKGQIEKKMTMYLQRALTSYAAALSACDAYDDSIVRLCSLWLQHDRDEAASQELTTALRLVPSHKFIVLGPQLAARLYRAKSQTQFNSLLNETILRVGQDHPYHILYQIITLAHGVAQPNAASRSKAATDAGLQNPRGLAASEMLAKLKASQSRPVAASATKYMTAFAHYSIKWCNLGVRQNNDIKSGHSYEAAPDSPIAACRNYPIPIATVIPAIDLNRQYANLPSLKGYKSRYTVANGIHKPAIMRAVDSLGQDHVQLFKGDDEVRQDAVMEQVFELTNRLLANDTQASVRKLKFRTYVVVPLANKTGIIEFVDNTTAIGDWLRDGHAKYRKHVDMRAQSIRDALSELQRVDHNDKKLVTVFAECMANFKPVMRHFFTEKRKEPLAWFTMRLNYARSVAVTAMVGYMVGLGDRHCSNILIDKVTGELVQIDFGIVFDEGSKLRIPEKVPFRLTQDTVDGLGINGVNGTFKQCAEHTLRVLRDSSELILTVLEVFKHDPLYAWTTDVEKIRRVQGSTRVASDPVAHTSAQEKADRVLTAIREKLSRDTSVENKVNQLIQQARATDHLATIFVGWQPWM